MIYSNIDIQQKDKEFAFGTMSVITLGEQGRGRQLIVLPSTIDIRRGVNFAGISFSRNGNPKINPETNDGRYLLINTYGGYTRRGDGWCEWNDSNLSILAQGKGADGDAGRIGYWNVYLFSITNEETPFWLWIHYSGGSKSENSWLYITPDNDGIVEIPESQIGLFCDMRRIDTPKKIENS